jgi:hypothetical protein
MWKKGDKVGKRVPSSEKRIRKVAKFPVVGNPDRKRRGEAAEAEFIARASGLDFRVAKPWGESDPYDVLIGCVQAFWRVQVKCASACRLGQYVVRGGGENYNYTKDDIDFLAAHIVPENIWYIVPLEAFLGCSMLHFSPRGTGKAKYEKYREAWCLLACQPKARGRKDIPALCRCETFPNAAPPATETNDLNDTCGPAAKRRKNAAHGVSRGKPSKKVTEPQSGRKNRDAGCPTFRRFLRKVDSTNLNPMCSWVLQFLANSTAR